MVPGLGDLIWFSIFMASIFSRVWPWATWSPSLTGISTTRPGMGEGIWISSLVAWGACWLVLGRGVLVRGLVVLEVVAVAGVDGVSFTS